MINIWENLNFNQYLKGDKMHLKLGQKIIDKIRGKSPSRNIMKVQLPSSCEKLLIDGDTPTIRYYVYDYENLANTLVKDKKTLFIDIGANEGQSVKSAYHFFNNVKVISYEPLKSCLHFLNDCKKKHHNYEYKNVAISNEVGEIEIKENKVSGLSSILDINKQYLPYSENHSNDIINVTKVNTTTIIEEAKSWNLNSYDLKILKLDTQGTELSILKAATDFLKVGNIDVVMIEIITCNKYEGQGYYMDTLKFMNECGFEIFNIKPGFRTKDNKAVAPEGLSYGMADEYDFTYIHKNTLNKISI